MSNPITLRATVGAYLPSSRNPADLLTALRRGDEKGAGAMLTYSPSDMTSYGWTRVGDAEVTITLAPHEEQVAQAVRTLQMQLQAERAESQQRQNAILERISKLQALTYEAA